MITIKPVLSDMHGEKKLLCWIETVNRIKQWKTQKKYSQTGIKINVG